MILAMTVAGTSGIFGIIAEALAPFPIISESLKGDNQLLRELYEKEEMISSVESIKRRAKASGNFASIQAALRRDAIDILRQKR